MATFNFTVPSVQPFDPPQTANRGYEDLSDAILICASGDYNVIRRAPPLYVAGRRQAPVQTVIAIIASVQPASGQVVQRLPEGKRDRETMMLYTQTLLKIAGATQECDIVFVDEAQFEVESCQRWARLGNFYECVITRKPGQ